MDHREKGRRTTPGRFESGRHPLPEARPFDDVIVGDAVRRVGNKEAAKRIRASLGAASLVIGSDTEWGPARRRDGTPNPDDITDLAYFTSEPHESGNAD
jgi:hypothetical protein